MVLDEIYPGTGANDLQMFALAVNITSFDVSETSKLDPAAVLVSQLVFYAAVFVTCSSTNV